ncbi:phospho-N-acetylmuramoyl-pentapeptide-transferase [Paenibacillus psychroresistens]|uniref:Phospho-N-acetylmuramoyl-pentapeptide-transferase n=1 Tax=Paenibacillus psychroresistens TaxID=1778678 RepID=A0A6B8RWV0_9BACL|nr:phospho-N-acetylmuramoyl-pentapeptide-transferase [Paenibacillus psychroresistens]QGR00076.1 phospho-N-acetylmuramoyl-pentapeptide-transferase [Paenibacillus psychroresistens]
MDFKEVLFPLVITFVFTMLVAPLFIPFLKRLKFGQQIRTDGPQSHLKKTGTPTMGGIIILLAIALASLKFIDKNSELIVLLVATLGFGLIGFLDDYIKIVFKRSLGLTARQKLVGQLIVSAIVCYYLVKMGHSTDLHIPFFDWSLSLGWLYFPFVALLMMGTTNAVNITDGLDGLLAGTSAIAFGGFVIVAMKGHSPEAAIFSAAMIGAVLGFLVFNAHPAKVFMGDTGSLGIGGGLVAVAILTKEEILLAIIGGVFVFEILSVIIQVISFKTRGKRVFKMSPIHHHFELVGWSEWRVVTTFWFVGILLAALGLYLNGVF